MAESNGKATADSQDLLPAPSTDATVPESFKSDSMVTALARLKEKISRLELDRKTAESDMKKLAEETSLFRAQMQGFDREQRGANRQFPNGPPPPPPPVTLSASQLSLGPRHFDGKETEDELFFVPEAKMVVQTVNPEERRVVSNTLDIVENRCFALEQEFRLMRELLEDADRNAVASRELLLARQSPAPPSPDVRQKRRRERLDHQLCTLLGPTEAPARPNSARKTRRPKEVAGNLRPHSAASGKPRKPRSRPAEDARAGAVVGEAERRKARAIVSDLHLELEGLKEEHRVLAHRLATESNRAQKALLMRDLDRVVRTMEQKGEQMGRIKTYVRRGHVGSRLVVRSKDSLTSDAAAKERDAGRRARKVNPTLSMGDVRWTSAP